MKIEVCELNENYVNYKMRKALSCRISTCRSSSVTLCYRPWQFFQLSFCLKYNLHEDEPIPWNLVVRKLESGLGKGTLTLLDPTPPSPQEAPGLLLMANKLS